MNNPELSIQLDSFIDLLARIYEVVLSWDVPVDTQQEKEEPRVAALEGVSISA